MSIVTSEASDSSPQSPPSTALAMVTMVTRASVLSLDSRSLVAVAEEEGGVSERTRLHPELLITGAPWVVWLCDRALGPWCDGVLCLGCDGVLRKRLVVLAEPMDATAGGPSFNSDKDGLLVMAFSHLFPVHW